MQQLTLSCKKIHNCEIYKAHQTIFKVLVVHKITNKPNNSPDELLKVAKHQKNSQQPKEVRRNLNQTAKTLIDN